MQKILIILSLAELPTPGLLKSGDSWSDRKNCSVCPLGSLWWSVLTRDHNTKRAKLSIDVCAMFVAAKAIFSNFAIARARLSNKRIQKPRANGPVRAHVIARAQGLKQKNLIF